MVRHPLADDRAIDGYTGPTRTGRSCTRSCSRLAGVQGEYWIVGVTVTIFETAWALRGYERLLTDFVEQPELAERILQIPYVTI